MRPPTVMRFCYHGIPASVCAGPCVPSSPPLPGALCFGGVLLPPSLLIRPHAPVSCPPANFPLTVISPASRARDLPYFASQTLRPCRRPPTPESSPGISARLFLIPGDPAFAEKTPARRSRFPANCLLAGKPHDAAAIPLCYGPVACSPPWAVPSYDGEDFILGASTEVVTQSRCPIRYAAVRLLPRPVLPRLA